MKNIIKGFLLSAAAITLFAGCAQEKFSAPKGSSLVFTAIIDQTATRTSIDANGTEGKVCWVEGDEITINGVAYTATPDADDATKATFTKKDGSAADPEAIDGKYYAAYGCSFDAAAGEGTLSAVQTYAEGSIANAPMYAESETTLLSFKNICGLLEISLIGDASASSISLSSDNLPMSGPFTVSDCQTAELTSAASGNVVLDCGAGVSLSSEGTKFYVAVPSGEYEGLSISVATTDNKIWSIAASKTAVVEPSMIYCLEFAPEFVEAEARYSNDGGATWTYSESFKAAIEGAEGTSSNPALVELLMDASHGYKDAIDVSNKYLEINGNGYTYDVSERPETGDSKSSAVFTVPLGGSDAAGEVTFTDITFDGDSYGAGSRLLYNYSSAEKFTFGSDVRIENVYYETAKNAAGIIYNDGGTIDIDGLIADNCSSSMIDTFAIYGGFIANYGGTVNVVSGTISNCIVNGADNKETRGGFAYNTSSGTVNISGGTIEGCEALYGGALYLYSGELNMSGGEISGCSANYGGAIDNRSSVNMTGGTISGCSASTWGGGLYNSGSGIAIIDGGTIENCTGGYGAGISVNNGSLTVESGTIAVSEGYAIAKTSNTSAATITINDGLVNSSDASAYAVYVGTKGGTLNLNGGEIKSDSYRALYLKASTFNMTSGLLNSSGYGIYAILDKADSLIINISDGEISASTGIYFYRNSSPKPCTCTISGGTFTTTSYGIGNMSNAIKNTDTVELSGGRFTSFTAAMRGCLKAGYQVTETADPSGYYEVIPL